MSDYSGRRITRTNEYEEWCFYKRGYEFVDRILVTFSEKINEVYLVTTHKNINMERKYISIVYNLVHDLENDFKVNIKYINIGGENDDEVVTNIVYDEMNKIKKELNIEIL